MYFFDVGFCVFFLTLTGVSKWDKHGLYTLWNCFIVTDNF